MLLASLPAVPVPSAPVAPVVKEKNAEENDDKGGVFPNVHVTLHLRDIHAHLKQLISESSYVVGCVAWITDRDTLRLLAEKLRGTSFVVQTETYLTRNNKYDRWREDLKKLYAALPPFPWHEWSKHHPNMPLPAYVRQPPYAVRVAGEKHITNPTRAQRHAHAKQHKHQIEDEQQRKKLMMHHKFLLFFDERMMPTAVWTGSYNLSFRARDSWENVTVLRDPSLQLQRAFFQEFLRVFESSSPYRT